MSSDLKALVERNDLKLPSERVESLKRMLAQKAVSHLSPERESGPFLLYCLGDDINTIAAKTSFPIEVIALTAMYYKWNEKIELYNKIRDKNPAEIQKDLVNSLLVATYVGISRELGDVIAGKKDAAECKLIPREIKDLEKLIAMVQSVNGAPAPEGGSRTVVHAQNVQINQQVAPDEKKEAKEISITTEKSKALSEL